MRTLTEAEFLHWAEDHGLALDAQYPESAVLAFHPEVGDALFWRVPAEPERRPYFLAAFLERLGDWTSCFVWRHLGFWPDTGDIDAQRPNDVVEHHIYQGLGLPRGTSDVVEFMRAESGALLTLLFSTTVFGWSVGEDLYVVPDHARYLLQTNHHGLVHVEFRDAGDAAVWVEALEAQGFPLTAAAGLS